MKPIEGLSAAELLAEAEADFKITHRLAVIKQMRHLLAEAENTAGKVDRLERDLAKARGQQKALHERIEAIRLGDWDKIPEPPRGADHENTK